MQRVPVKIFSKTGRIPKYANSTDSGFDIEALLDISSSGCYIPPGGTKKIGTGLFFQIADGYEIQLRPRSGLNAKGIFESFGTIDNGYTGELICIIFNSTDKEIIIKNGERIAQGVIAPVYHADFIQVKSVEEFNNTDRGSAGLGSTGI